MSSEEGTMKLMDAFKLWQLVDERHLHDPGGHGSVSTSHVCLKTCVDCCIDISYGAGLGGATNVSAAGLYDTKAKDALGTKLGKSDGIDWIPRSSS